MGLSSGRHDTARDRFHCHFTKHLDVKALVHNLDYAAVNSCVNIAEEMESISGCYLIVVGTRPEIIKMAPLVRAMRDRSVPCVFVHCGQPLKRYLTF